MNLWQADFYRRPLQDEAGNPLWELVVCAADRSFTASAYCPQPEANSAWIAQQLQRWIETEGTPDRIQVFRPQSVSLLQAACQPLGIAVEPTRRTPVLKQQLQARVQEYRTLPNYTGQPYEPVQLEQPPPVPLPENLWGNQWRFAAIEAPELQRFQHRPIPILEMPEVFLPLKLQLPSTALIPGVVIDGGRRSMPLAQWIQRSKPVALNYIPGQPDGLILEAGLVERWILTTFEDPEVITAARTFQQRQHTAKGLHFLLVQPDDSGMTYSGFWLLQKEF
ncbi:Tab2/Atab2 family RNA-binding protein [Thermocoleostomius sinensis]|uniref:Tab2/Atab2 family RNA-binding protein n=1 Tax=Thermocoleostomius sinensis A174 TaxID=2016057 RepID=A0A9E9CBX5_9CYAN|nr:Tab2/Atab2 family RNA-binding protein [Thermocoleostomius sinensis]WAL61415.1 Tab2/Atab2 family RNA-binding protein [Thermocoleostomius sinensis A174]